MRQATCKGSAPRSWSPPARCCGCPHAADVRPCTALDSNSAKENLRRRTDLSMDREPWCTCTKKLMKIRFTGRCLRCQDVRTFKACIESLFGRHQRGVLLVFFYQIAMLRRLRQEPRATVPTIPQLGASVPNVSRVRESARERRKTERERKTERKQQQRRGNLSRSVCFEQILGGGGRGGRGGGGGG